MINMIEYQEKALQTLRDLGRGENMLHAAYGLIDEVGELFGALKKHRFYGKELDITNVKEELGDALWFLSIAYHELNMPFVFHDLTGMRFSSSIRHLNSLQTSVSTFFKKVVNKCELGPNEEIVDFIFEGMEVYAQAVAVDLQIVALKFGFTMEEVGKANNEKLLNKDKGRYKEGAWSKDAAINRDVNAERDILESN